MVWETFGRQAILEDDDLRRSFIEVEALPDQDWDEKGGGATRFI